MRNLQSFSNRIRSWAPGAASGPRRPCGCNKKTLASEARSHLPTAGLRWPVANTSRANACAAPPLPPLFPSSFRSSRKPSRPSLCWHCGAGAGPVVKCADLGPGAPEARKSPPHPWPSESVLVPPGPNANQSGHSLPCQAAHTLESLGPTKDLWRAGKMKCRKAASKISRPSNNSQTMHQKRIRNSGRLRRQSCLMQFWGSGRRPTYL